MGTGHMGWGSLPPPLHRAHTGSGTGWVTGGVAQPRAPSAGAAWKAYPRQVPDNSRAWGAGAVSRLWPGNTHMVATWARVEVALLSVSPPRASPPFQAKWPPFRVLQIAGGTSLAHGEIISGTELRVAGPDPFFCGIPRLRATVSLHAGQEATRFLVFCPSCPETAVRWPGPALRDISGNQASAGSFQRQRQGESPLCMPGGAAALAHHREWLPLFGKSKASVDGQADGQMCGCSSQQPATQDARWLLSSRVKVVPRSGRCPHLTPPGGPEATSLS